jgi:hypothetical protein
MSGTPIHWTSGYYLRLLSPENLDMDDNTPTWAFADGEPTCIRCEIAAIHSYGPGLPKWDLIESRNVKRCLFEMSNTFQWCFPVCAFKPQRWVWRSFVEIRIKDTGLLVVWFHMGYIRPNYGTHAGPARSV